MIYELIKRDISVMLFFFPLFSSHCANAMIALILFFYIKFDFQILNNLKSKCNHGKYNGLSKNI